MDRPGLELKRTALGYPVSPRLSRGALGMLMQAASLPRDGSLHFPPEFKFCPLSGEPLAGRQEHGAQAGSSEAWVAPHGAAPHAAQAGRAAAGLRQSARPLMLARPRRHDPEARPDASLPMPPHGDYELFSASFGSAEPVLVALDPGKGTLFAWLSTGEEWAELENGKPLLLSESALPRGAWRAELAHNFHSRIYLPTERGLACVTPDVAALVYEVTYVGDGPALGAPISFDGRVWAPCREAGGVLAIVGADPAGGPALRLVLPAGAEPGEASAPVAYGRIALWPCAGGQLRLHKQVSGEVLASFIPWPAGIAPQFQFGSPYLALDGALWQICFDNASQQYTYLKLGTDQAEQAAASSPRLCSGSYTYRFSTRFTDEPWNDPEQGDDSTPSEVIVPLVESTATKSVIGLKIESHQALETLLASTERMRAELVIDDAAATTGFHTIAVVQPWRLRLFRYAGRQWAYHPLLKSIDGWDLQA